MPYLFEPPTVPRPFSLNVREGAHRLWGRVTYPAGLALVRRPDGSFKTSPVVDRDDPEADFIYVGGHVYTVSDDEAAQLQGAGYGSYLRAVSP